MAVIIVSDSTSEIEKEEQISSKIKIAPLSITFGEKTYLDGETLSKREFYKLQAQSKELPTTSQVNPEQFIEIFKEAIENGDEVVGVFISSGISGTYQSAVIAKEMLGSDKIHLHDSKSATMGLTLLVREAVKMRDENKNAEEISEIMVDLIDRLEFVAAVKTLKYLKMGGRISAATAMVGGVLGISPVVAFIDGKLESVAKVKGDKARVDYMLNILKEKPFDENYPLGFAHSDAPEIAEEISKTILEKYSGAKNFTVELGATIGTHAGPGCFGMAYIKK